MNFPRYFRLAMVALIPAAMSSGVGGALAQSPPAAPPAASTPATPAPAASETPAPAPTATPAPAASPSAAPTTPPAAAETPATPPPAAAAPVQTADPFGEQITLAPKTVVIVKGNANWDSAFDTLIESLKSLSAFLDKQGIKP